MRRVQILIVSAVFVLMLVGFTATYTVRFTEKGVLTTFGKATEADVKKEAGLYFKWPYPIQSVTKYDTRLRVLNIKLEQQQTADNTSITVESYATWRVSDPLKFFQRFSNQGSRPEDHYQAAEGVLKNALRAAMAQVSSYRMDALFNPSGSKLPELEGRILGSFQARSEQSGLSLGDYGIEATSVGISRIVLPESVTSAVFEAMKQRRDVLAQSIGARGDAEADTIKGKAEADARTISAFAAQLADQIRSQGDLEAAQYLKQMGSNPELAVFLSTMDFFKTSLSKRTTLVMSAETPGAWLLFPDALSKVKMGSIPGIRPGSAEARTHEGEVEKPKSVITPRRSSDAEGASGGGASGGGNP